MYTALYMLLLTSFNLSRFQDRNPFLPQDGSKYSQVCRMKTLSEPGFESPKPTTDGVSQWRSVSK